MKTMKRLAKGLATLVLTASVCFYSNGAVAEKGINLKPLLRNGIKLNKAPSHRIRAINLGGRNHSSRTPNLSHLRDVGKRLGASGGHNSHGSRYGNTGLHVLNGQDIQDAVGFLQQNYGDRRGGHYDDRWNGGYDDYYRDSDREYARAYRDVGIANAVANVVGTIVNGPAVVGQPYGTYGRQRVVLTPGYYEQVQVWVPDMTDPRTGDRIMGHYETRQRWVPEVYGYQDLRVP